VLVNEYTMLRILQSEVCGFVDKGLATTDMLKEAIGTAIKGGTYFSPVVERTRQEMSDNPDAFKKLLTPHEMDLLQLMGQGLSNAEVARKFGLADPTVKAHRRNIMSKLKIHSKTDLIRFAVHKGLTKL
jgi:DNA-binding NarL/FixJ family response regulator